MLAQAYPPSRTGLPDPVLDRQFYEGVPGRRLAAWLVDAAVVLLITLPVTLVAGVFTLGLGFLLFPLIWPAISFAYRTATLASRSATPGMRLFGIEMRRRDGSRFDPLTAALHVGFYLGSTATVVVQAASMVAIAVTPLRQGLHDMLLGTTAINRPAD